MDNAPICFDDWEHALRTSVPADRHHAYREAIVKFRYWLRETGKLPDATTFREHLEWKKSYPGDFSDFVRARRGRKVPTVLTQAECKRLFEAMAGTYRLMVELMYAAGLRLSELLRLGELHAKKTLCFFDLPLISRCV